MALTREKKEKIIAEIKDIALTASSLVISDARGLKVSEISEIRKDGNQSGIQIKVVKNSLAKLAFDGTDFNCTNEVLNGPSLFAFSFDEPGAAAKLIKSYAKNFEALEVKALSVEGKLLSADQIDVLAKLPSHIEGITILASILQAPVSKFARLLNELPGKLARTLQAVHDKKQAVA